MLQYRRTVICPVIIGRDDLLDLAERRLLEVAGGHGHLLFVAGEAGIGKTRFVGAIERRANANGWRTVRAATFPSDLDVTAAILVDLARTLQGTGSQSPTADLGRRLASRLAEGLDSPGDVHRRRRLFVLDVADLLSGLSAEGPTLLVLEDLHWADDLTLEILAALAMRLSSTSLFVVATFRSDELFPRVPMRDWRARLLTQRLAEEVHLRRLDRTETATMIGLIVGDDRPPAQDIAAAIHARTDGIPLHIEEFLGVLEVGAMVGVEAIDAAGAPDTLGAAIITRLAMRSLDAARVAQAGAVIGRAFDLDLLTSVLGEDPGWLNSPLAELADHQILLPTRTAGRLGFRHGLICDAIYDHIPEPERRRLHLRTAEAAAERPDVGTDAFVSSHFERAGRRAEAFAAASAGARVATALSSHGEARRLYERAVRTAPPDIDQSDLGVLLEALATSCSATDHNVEAADAFERARVAYRAAGRTLAGAAVVDPLVAVRHRLGDDLEARASRLRVALAELDPAPGSDVVADDPATDRVRGQLLAGLAAAYMLDRRLDAAIGYGLDARLRAIAVGDGPVARHAAATLGAAYVFAGRTTDGWRLMEGVIAEAKTEHDEREASRGYRMLGSVASVVVDYERAEPWLREGTEYAERVELWNDRHYMAAHLAHVLWATGRWDEAHAIAAASLADGRGGITTRITALHVLGLVALGHGDFDRSEATLLEARALGLQMHELQRVSPATWGLAETAWLRGDLATAERYAREGLDASAEVLDATYLFPFLVTGTRVLLARADPLGAERWLVEVAALVEARGIPGTLPSIAHARGLVLAAGGSTGQARTELEAAVVAWDGLGRTWEGTWARIDLARCLRRANQRTEAQREARTARDVAVRLGSSPLLAAADDLLGVGWRHDSALDPWAPLTAREFEVARLVAEGLTNVQVAGALRIARKTVSAHLEHIFAKLAVSRRAEVAAWVARVTVLHSGPHGGDREE